MHKYHNNYVDTFLWKSVPDRLCDIVKVAGPVYRTLIQTFTDLPAIDADVYYFPLSKQATFVTNTRTDVNKAVDWLTVLEAFPGIEKVSTTVNFAAPTDSVSIRIKCAQDPIRNSDIFGPIASVMQQKPNAFNNALFGGPNPLLSTLAGGLLGGAVGYGGGWLAEKLLPQKYFERGKLRRTAALLGALPGLAHGISWGVDNYNQMGLPGLVSPYPFKTTQASALNANWIKYAEEAGSSFDTKIPVDQFNRVIWNDLSTFGGGTKPPLAAATTGLVQAASLSREGTNLISPADIARVGIGMGSGWLSGLVVGKTLGAMAGLRPEAQNTLQRTGMWAGLLSNVVPMIFS